MQKNPMNLTLTTFPSIPDTVFANANDVDMIPVATVTAPDGYDQATLLRAMALTTEMYGLVEMIVLGTGNQGEVHSLAASIYAGIYGDAE